MGDNLKKVQPGDRLVIPAATFNAFIDAAQDQRRRQRGLSRESQPVFQQTGIILVRNDTGNDLDRFSVVGIDGPIIEPSDNEDEFKNRATAIGVTPSGGVHDGKFAVLLEPLKSGAIGRGCVSGVCPALIQMDHDHHEYADIEDGETGHLLSVPSGSAQILWKETSEESLKLAIVRLGNPSTSLALVLVVKDGGVAGDDITDCTFTYAIHSISDQTLSDPLAEALSPKRRRLPKTTYIAAVDGSWGLAAFRNQTWSLLDVYEELPDTAVCTEEA